MIQLSHLTGDQIEWYLKRGSVKSNADQCKSVETHLSSCSLCLERALEILEPRLPADHPYIRASRQNLAFCRAQLQDG